ncbi:MAG: type II toxin-antitoxin system RelE/ParE family toxin [Chryseotalea sp. WA131a]|nr:MAG: type II toxin-antitoxin system RelE/ParE family toxin [Chryseotalea sp. WA131a]
MRVEFLSKFNDDLDSISQLSVKIAIKKVIESIEASESIRQIQNAKKLVGYKNAYRVRVGNYRIGFYLENNLVQLARVKNRKDIYKLFP